MSKGNPGGKIIVFSCTWHPHSSLVSAGKDGRAHSAAVIPIRFPCLGRISPGIILQAYEGGAAGVCLLGCPDGQCRYQNGNTEARQAYWEARALLKLLGYDENTLQYHLLPAEEGGRYLEIIDQMLDAISGKGGAA